MKKPTPQQAVVVGVLSMFASAGVFALVITYMGYLPTISSFPWHKSDATAADYSYRIAQNSFAIAALSGGVLGFAVPKIFRISRDKYEKHAVQPAASNAGIASHLTIGHHWPGVPQSER